MQFPQRLLLALTLFAVTVFGSVRIAESSASWPNEPSGATVLTDNSFNTVNGNGWTCYCGDVSVVPDPSAPLSASNVAQFRYGIGFTAGISPGHLYFPLNQLDEVYVGFWWKPSNPWQSETNSNVNKISYLQTTSAGSYIFEMNGPQGGPYNLILVLSTVGPDNSHLGNGYGDRGGTWMLFSNNGASRVTLGQWHRVELYVKKSTTTTSRDGVIRWWMNGVLQGNYTNVNSASEKWSQFTLNPTWGGLNNTKKQTDYYWFDHVHISSPNGTATNPDSPPGPPAAPRILNVTVR